MEMKQKKDGGVERTRKDFIKNHRNYRKYPRLDEKDELEKILRNSRVRQITTNKSWEKLMEELFKWRKKCALQRIRDQFMEGLDDQEG